MKELWKRLETWLMDHYPELLDSLNDGATDDMIFEAEEKMGMSLPNDFVESLKLHNGQKDDFYPGLIGGHQLLSLDDIVAWWQMWNNQLEEGCFNDWEELDFNTNKVKTDQWWRAKWIPIAWRRYNCYCLDLDPSPDGSIGQVIEFLHENEWRKFVGDSFEECFKTMVENLENGTYLLQEDEDGDLDFNFRGFNQINLRKKKFPM
jgi:cell wall assembly regulator SMI1